MAFIYSADIYCDECGKAIRARLTAEGKAPADPDDEYTYDSDDFPKYTDADGEADSPQHCGSGAECLSAEVLPSERRIGALIGTSLTSDGIDYVRESAKENPDSEVIKFWKEQFDYIDF